MEASQAHRSHTYHRAHEAIVCWSPDRRGHCLPRLEVAWTQRSVLHKLWDDDLFVLGEALPTCTARSDFQSVLDQAEMSSGKFVEQISRDKKQQLPFFLPGIRKAMMSRELKSRELPQAIFSYGEAPRRRHFLS